MDHIDNDGGISAQLRAAAVDLSPARVRALPGLASARVRDQMRDLTDQALLNHTAVTALAACQQALMLCAEVPGTGDVMTMDINAAATQTALRAVAAGANALGARGQDGLALLVNRVLPPIAEAIIDHDGERRVHGIVLAFLLGLSQGTARRGPAAGVEGGLLRAFPFPEPQMRSKPGR